VSIEKQWLRRVSDDDLLKFKFFYLHGGSGSIRRRN